MEGSEADDSNKKSELMKTSIKYIAGDLNSDLYALPTKKQAAPEDKIKECTATDEVGHGAEEEDEGEEKGKQEDVEGIEEKDANKDLPPGWEKHEDNDGPYYWHIKSGTIQREPPVWPKDAPKELKTPVISPNPSPFLVTMRNHNQMSTSRNLGRMQDNHVLSVTRSNTSMALDQDDERRRKEELAYKRRSFPLKSDTDRPIRFAVRSLGWVEIAEEDLTPERSSKAVNKCIVDLSLGRNDLLDVVGRWGDVSGEMCKEDGRGVTDSPLVTGQGFVYGPGRGSVEVDRS